MQVETYECQETTSEPIEATEEAVALIEQLGLEGQSALLGKGTTDVPSRVPYPEATAEQMRVFETLCPSRIKASQYRRGPIPLRVLQVLAHAQSLGFFEEFMVWDRESQEVVDPVLVGVVKTSQYIWENKHHILARWGEHLDEWPAMVRAAKRIIHARAIEAVRNGFAQLNEKKAILDATRPEELSLTFSV